MRLLNNNHRSTYESVQFKLTTTTTKKLITQSNQQNYGWQIKLKYAVTAQLACSLSGFAFILLVLSNHRFVQRLLAFPFLQRPYGIEEVVRISVSNRILCVGLLRIERHPIKTTVKFQRRIQNTRTLNKFLLTKRKVKSVRWQTQKLTSSSIILTRS